MKAVVVKEPHVVEVIDVELPQTGPYQALVRTRLASLCNGTDSKLVSGAFPSIDRYPLAPGHESAGTVEVVGDKVRNFALGDTVISGLVLDFEEDIARSLRRSVPVGGIAGQPAPGPRTAPPSARFRIPRR